MKEINFGQCSKVIHALQNTVNAVHPSKLVNYDNRNACKKERNLNQYDIETHAISKSHDANNTSKSNNSVLTAHYEKTAMHALIQSEKHMVSQVAIESIFFSTENHDDSNRKMLEIVLPVMIRTSL